MCGICGLAQPRGRAPFPPGLLEGMLASIVHRGPDDEGRHVEPEVALGARRLSIIDVEGGHQPLSNEDGTVWIAYNGEAFNFPEVRAELRSRGHRFRTRTDTETLVHAYEEWGEDFLERFRGMFAFALWDRKAGKLLLVRDRLGIKPLYYSLLRDGTLVFGSELKSLLLHPGLERTLDLRALDLFLTVEYVPAPHSIFRDVRKLPAGHILTYQDGRTTLKKYWDIEGREGDGPPPGRPEEAMDRLYELLKESVRLRLLSDVPLGAFLSGGIDSSAIVGLMRELGASPLMTFSIGFDDPTYNELDYARRAARAFGTEHSELVLRPQALELTERLVGHMDEPFGDFSMFPTYLVSKLAREKVKVVLSGDGGDEIFGGYEHYQAQALASNPAARAVAALLGPAVKRLPPSAKKKGFRNKLRRFVQGLDMPAGARHMRWMMFLSPARKRGLYTDAFLEAPGRKNDIADEEPFASVLGKLGAFDPLTAELYLDLKTYLVDDILVKVDRMSMAVSLEARVPLLDHKVVEYAFGLPGEWKLREGTTKWIFKKTMERLLPRENIHRPKEGFSIPIKHWLKTDLRDMLLDHLSPER
ncbi:MAG: asparagine synthase (glutamine-hydrolyzing), partial [Candidatus Aminicenantes bacterium]|nr:asparagine synthase (glutamine-hydrolyzing) [Candidatus Aminicenantes bacterium]